MAFAVTIIHASFGMEGKEIYEDEEDEEECAPAPGIIFDQVLMGSEGALRAFGGITSVGLHRRVCILIRSVVSNSCCHMCSTMLDSRSILILLMS